MFDYLKPSLTAFFLPRPPPHFAYLIKQIAAAAAELSTYISSALFTERGEGGEVFVFYYVKHSLPFSGNASHLLPILWQLLWRLLMSVLGLGIKY